MATERLSMRKTREILRQKWELGRTHREIAASVGQSLGAVAMTLGRARAAGLDWAQTQVSPPTSGGTRITDITGHQGPTRWRRDTRLPGPRRLVAQEGPHGGGRMKVLPERAARGQVADGRYPFPSITKRSERSVSRSAMTWALRASGKTLGQSLKGRLVVMQVARRCS